MVGFWIWAVRNPLVLLAGLATAAGLTGVADWSLAMATVLVAGVVADAANHLARRATARKAREQRAHCLAADPRRAAGFLQQTGGLNATRTTAITIDPARASAVAFRMPMVSIGGFFRLPEAERRRCAMHLAQLPFSESHLKLPLHPDRCMDDGDTRDW